MNVGIIILAAGESKRMGIPKQLLDIHGTPMLKRIIESALATTCFPITVVLGAHKKEIVPILTDMPINIIDNPNWKTGMASSVKMGLVGSYLITKELEGIIMSTSDMPAVNENVFNQLVEKAKSSEKNLICSNYGEAQGVPLLIKRALFEEILNLEGDAGLRQIFEKYPKEIDSIDFKGGARDLDTKEDYLQYLNSPN